ncbi:hypothetical protein NNJEOMEG_02607 [Fundidesulfovibrio magnetotacticus]|uniref:Transglycosylase SLT domain-containing protein n=1 Tax=Fundidesulfovibrio magnetotacticus TaxID=2730080 RepID=A0A6V8LUX4_9BACT|nr:lytic transglycosylase domain-containing protein [Fundidesulfovibrio magnetotacticus]GFK94760.1 hypothetical protein NNJEOMEG_02607 [Fundidesulfovibrio magnetotacticus]
MSRLYEQLVADVAQELLIPVSLALALVQVESGFDPTAWNPEPRYRYVVDCRTGKPFRTLTPEERGVSVPPADFPAPAGADRDAEWWGQRASWGLCQVMGANARALGYRGKFLTGLCCDPAEGVRLGLKHLRKLADHFLPATGWQGVMAAYNAGSPRRAPGGAWENQDYVDKIASALNGAWPK